MSRSIAAALLLLVAGCFKVVEPPCAHRCVDGGRCPDNYTCLSDGVCHLGGHMTTCQFLDLAETDDGGADGSPDDGGDGGADAHADQSSADGGEMSAAPDDLTAPEDRFGLD